MPAFVPAFVIRYSIFNIDVLSEGNVDIDVTKMLPELEASMTRRKSTVCTRME